MKFKINIKNIANLACIFLIILIFISKISLKWTRVLPYTFPPLIFQYGLHPYINFGLQAFLTIILFSIWFKTKEKKQMSLVYKTFIYCLVFVLVIQTAFQIVLVNVSFSPLMQILGLGMALMLILVYGIIIPSIFNVEDFLHWTLKISVALVVGSFIFLPFLYADMFKGGRFIGFFKHIPHMVSASTIAFIFYLPKLFQNAPWTLKNNGLLKLIVLSILFICVVLTSTKAAFITVIIAIFISVIVLGNKKRSMRIFKFTFLGSILVSILLLGVPTTEFMYDISTGKIGFGMRPAQDGVQSRMEEVSRGWEMFDKSPYFGLGLLYKFLNGSKEGIEVESYNSFKDPHNLFVSAAVIGGYPLLALGILGYLLMIIGAFIGLNSLSVAEKTLGIFLISHLPVFVIYHAHFSLGGMADRLYWLVFGYLGLSHSSKNN